ncbi:Bax inhibitor-1/YccA family protein [secondary endosymbiont of Ctenarytaina eucalypti]|uniref:FtsH-interacting integral membrane protein n=1 Tax=secondary endosymbiont of Ctenarytaina eucalypti TaxID=1199245 RepID=J3TEY0_9ENTR|nr:Bax inhibitor-1/YccA family protein [secondary endosymbiont of Ctenarytaina eucalypti]AFP84492.1 FtsH-interacting integral membrane protein [secondary endosymbiont of Ctenarytaina eucalypti]
MDRFSRPQGSIVERVNSTVQPFMAQVYGWMTCGLLLTAFVAWYASRTPELMQFICSSQLIFFSLMIAQLVLVFVISSMIGHISGSVATSLFMLYSSLTGLVLASVFIVYTASSIASTFLVTAGMFGAMTLYGYTTQRDLSTVGNLLLMALIGILLASLVNVWIKSSALMWAVTYVGVLVFVGLTAYDTKKLKNMGAELSLENKEQFRKCSIVGALSLYLDFINLFLVLLRIFGHRRSS